VELVDQVLSCHDARVRKVFHRDHPEPDKACVMPRELSSFQVMDDAGKILAKHVCFLLMDIATAATAAAVLVIFVVMIVVATLVGTVIVCALIVIIIIKFRSISKRRAVAGAAVEIAAAVQQADVLKI